MNLSPCVPLPLVLIKGRGKEILRGGGAPSLFYSPLQPIELGVFTVTLAGEGLGVRLRQSQINKNSCLLNVASLLSLCYAVKTAIRLAQKSKKKET